MYFCIGRTPRRQRPARLGGRRLVVHVRLVRLTRHLSGSSASSSSPHPQPPPRPLRSRAAARTPTRVALAINGRGVHCDGLDLLGEGRSRRLVLVVKAAASALLLIVEAGREAASSTSTAAAAAAAAAARSTNGHISSGRILVEAAPPPWLAALLGPWHVTSAIAQWIRGAPEKSIRDEIEAHCSEKAHASQDVCTSRRSRARLMSRSLLPDQSQTARCTTGIRVTAR